MSPNSHWALPVLLLVPGTQILLFYLLGIFPLQDRVALLCINYMEVLATGPGGQSGLSSEVRAVVKAPGVASPPLSRQKPTVGSASGLFLGNWGMSLCDRIPPRVTQEDGEEGYPESC